MILIHPVVLECSLTRWNSAVNNKIGITGMAETNMMIQMDNRGSNERIFRATVSAGISQKRVITVNRSLRSNCINTNHKLSGDC